MTKNLIWVNGGTISILSIYRYLRMKKQAMKSGSKKTNENQKSHGLSLLSYVYTNQVVVSGCKLNVVTSCYKLCVRSWVYLPVASDGQQGFSTEVNILVVKAAPPSKASWTMPMNLAWKFGETTGATPTHWGYERKVVCLKVRNDEDV